MPDDKPTNPEEHNKKVADTVADQDISGHSASPLADPLSIEALDRLMEEKVKEKTAPPKPDDTPPKPDDTPPKPDDTPPKPDDTPPKPDDTQKTDDEATKKVEELFKDVALPPGARPRSAEAFATVKVKAAQEIASRDKKIEELSASVKALEEKLRNPVPKEVNDELESLRQFRAKLDVRLDPKFKQFDSKVNELNEFIYSQLKGTGVINDEHIQKIKQLGGPANVNLDKIFAAVNDPTVQKNVEATVLEISRVQFSKEQAIKSAEDNVAEYIKSREQEFEKSRSSHTEATNKHLGELTKKLDWLGPLNSKNQAEVDEHAKFVKETTDSMNTAVADDSPEMRAILIAGMGQLLYAQRLIPALRATNANLTKQLKEANEKLERFKSASLTRLEDTAAPASGKTPQPEKDIFSASSGDALDKLRNQIVQARVQAT